MGTSGSPALSRMRPSCSQGQAGHHWPPVPALTPPKTPLKMGQEEHKPTISFASAADRQAGWHLELQGYSDQFILRESIFFAF